jgi:alkylated DNA repair protein (DNA oxidative demethylase)
LNAAESTIILTLDLETQRRLVDQVREVLRASPLVQPIAVGGKPMSVRISSAGELGWVADGQYRYTDKDSKGRPWPPIPAEWIEISDRAVALDPRHVGPPPRWDSSIVNWYPPGASLGWHEDKQEHDRRQSIVTISLGFAARWGVEVERQGTDDLGRAMVSWERSRARLPSGAVTVLAGEMRGVPHTIEGLILPEDYDANPQTGLFYEEPETSPIVDTDGNVVPGRISITVRQAGTGRRTAR